MSRTLGNFGLLLSGAVAVFLFEYSIFPVVSRALTESGYVTAGRWLYREEIMSDRGKTKVYRYNGNQFLRLYEFCTWTAHVNCVTLKTPSGSTPIHIHDFKVDIWLSASVQKTGSWEPVNVDLILAELKKDPDLGFMDLGSHVGVFSLSVAKFGRKVVSVDPVIENVQRLCKSVQKGRFTDQVTVIFNPLSDEHTMVNFNRVHGNNVGSTRVTNATRRNITQTPCEESEASPTVMLDDLIPLVPFRKAVIKMDVQEYEYHVLKGASKFFQQIHVTAILMEWVMMKTTADGGKLVDLLLGYKFKAYEALWKGKELDPKNYTQWPYDIIWRRQ